MKQINEIMDDLKKMLYDMNFSEIVVTNPYRSEINFVRGDLYCIPHFIEKIGFFIEYADSYEEAKNHGHEDGDAFPLEMGVKAILDGIKNEISQNIK